VSSNSSQRASASGFGDWRDIDGAAFGNRVPFAGSTLVGMPTRSSTGAAFCQVNIFSDTLETEHDTQYKEGFLRIAFRRESRLRVKSINETVRKITLRICCSEHER
jgi:hypothetical protein